MKLKIKLLFLFFVIFSTLVAQPPITDAHKQGKRPKIGLVLSGGGAKGLAHIGVLKVLEEVGIVPDYIAGTSMGSIIGGLYASGYTAAEISELNHTISWGDYLTNIIPMDQISMEQKYDYGRYFVEFPVRGTKVYLPSGIIESQSFWQLFHNLTWPVLGINNFDSLPIPFRCCATEILGGNVRTFSHASLPTSMRASMAIPGVFSPVVESDTIVYVDGGVGRNFPVQEVLDMGADIVIGVYVGPMEALDPMMARSFDKILMQTAFYAGLKESREVMDKCDILIIPNLHGLGSQSFERGKEIERYGYKTALEQKEKLKHLADSVYSMGPPPVVHSPNRNRKFHIKEITVEGTKNVTPEFVVAKSRIKPGDSVARETLNRAMENIFGTLYFDRLAYHFEPSENGYNLVFMPQEKEPQLLKGAVQANNFWGPSLLLNYTHNSFLSKESRFITRLEISKIPRLYASHMQFIGKRQRQSYELALFADADEIPIYMTTYKIGNIQESSYGVLFAVNNSFNNNNQLSMGATFGIVSLHSTNSFKVLFPEKSLESLHYGGLKLWGEFRKNSLDRHYFPRRGSKIDTKLLFGPKPFLEVSHQEGAGILDSVNVPDNYAKLSFSYERHLTVGKHLTWMFGTDVRFVTKNAPDFDVSYIGATDYTTRARDVAFYGFGYREGNIPNFVIAKTELRAKVWSEFYSMARINYFQGASKELDVVDRAFDPEYDVFGFAAGIGYNSIAGPMTVWVASNTMNQNVWWYFSFGYNF